MHPNVWVLSLTVGLMSAAYYTWAPLLPIHLRELGASDFQVGLTYAAATLSLALFQVYGGRLADRFGRKPVITFPTFTFAPLAVALAFGRHWTVALLVLAAMNAMTSLQIPGFIALMGESAPPDKKGKAFALLNFFWGVGIAGGPGVGALLLGSLGVRGLMLLTAGMSLLMGFTRLWLLQEPARKEEASPISLRALLRERSLYPIILLLSLVGVVFSLTIMGPFVPLYARDVLSLGEKEINFLYSAGALAALIGPFLGGIVIDRYTSRVGLGLGLAGHLGLLLLWMGSRGTLPTLLSFAGSYIFLQVTWTAYDTFLSDVAAAKGGGSVIGLIGTLTSSMGALGPPLGGLVRDSWGPEAVFWLATALGVLAMGGLKAVPGELFSSSTS
ncbi:MAG: MFS transporter [Armatimonadota bacterium]|nr:MFS transporter [Armatimonadota bacterium]